MDRPSCASCVFWDCADDMRESPLDHAEPCKVDGPQLSTGEVFGAWPYTRPKDWCGKHRAIRPKKAPEKPVSL